MSFVQQQNEFIQFKSEFIFGKYILRLTLCELHQPFVAMYQCFTLCAHLFFSLINTTKLFDLVSFVISRIFCILHNISCISCFCDFSCCAFLAATKSHCLPSREPNQLDLSDLFLWFSVLCISYIFCQRGCGWVDAALWPPATAAPPSEPFMRRGLLLHCVSIITRPKPAYGLQGRAGGIVGPWYSSSGYILGCSQRLASCLRCSARFGYCSTNTHSRKPRTADQNHEKTWNYLEKP